MFAQNFYSHMQHKNNTILMLLPLHSIHTAMTSPSERQNLRYQLFPENTRLHDLR